MNVSSRILFALLLWPAVFFAQSKYEFRGVWVATVANIDWPKGGVTDPAQQRADFIRLLDQHHRNGMNAMIVQVRPAADAFYPSSYEPWSEWLTGQQGKPPAPYWDPLSFMIEETHKRGMEFHAWLNPYRAVQTIGKSSIAPAHITKIRPQWFLNYGDKKYFDPGNRDAQRFVVQVVRDIVERYPVDAIHMDDYFYPYVLREKNFRIRNRIAVPTLRFRKTIGEEAMSILLSLPSADRSRKSTKTYASEYRLLVFGVIKTKMSAEVIVVPVKLIMTTCMPTFCFGWKKDGSIM